MTRWTKRLRRSWMESGVRNGGGMGLWIRGILHGRLLAWCGQAHYRLGR